MDQPGRQEKTNHLLHRQQVPPESHHPEMAEQLEKKRLDHNQRHPRPEPGPLERNRRLPHLPRPFLRMDKRPRRRTVQRTLRPARQSRSLPLPVVLYK